MRLWSTAQRHEDLRRNKKRYIDRRSRMTIQLSLDVPVAWQWQIQTLLLGIAKNTELYEKSIQPRRISIFLHQVA